MSLFHCIKTIVWGIFFLLPSAAHSQTREKIEKHLVEERVVSSSQYKQYQDKEKADQEYIRMMIKLMKEDSGYSRELEQKYREETANKKTQRDTLMILSEILETSRTKMNYPRDTVSGIAMAKLTGYVHHLHKMNIIAAQNAERLIELLHQKHLYDSGSIVNHAMETRNKTRQNTKPELTILMGQLKDAGILSESNYRRLLGETIPDSVNKIKYIISRCEKTFLPDINSMYIRSKEEFFSLMNGLSRLTGIEVSEITNDFIVLHSDSTVLHGLPVINLSYQHKLFSHRSNEVWSYEKKAGPYNLTGHDYYEVFNKVLAYTRSSFRLYEIKENNPLSYSSGFWSGFIMLTDSQRKSLYQNRHLDLSYAEHMAQMDEKNIRNAVAVYKKTKLLAGMADQSIDSIITAIGQDPVYRYNELVSRFTAISVTVDEKLPLTVKEAIGLIHKMAAISGYAFNPQQVRVEKLPGDEFELSFVEKGIHRRTVMRSYIQWDEIWYLIHDCVFTDVNRKGQFEVLRISPVEVTYVYMSHDQMEKLKAAGVVDDY